MRRAIDAAYSSKDGWGHTLAAERELILQRAADVLEKARPEIVGLLIDEAGSTFGKSQFEVSFTVNMLRAVSGEARRIQGDDTVHDEATVPFGGVKDSGSGREGDHWSMDELTETKWITIQLGRRPYPF
jgi:acyl-CoA reductase-like NAD-dependent aldehyde dehydrogenase